MTRLTDRASAVSAVAPVESSRSPLERLHQFDHRRFSEPGRYRQPTHSRLASPAPRFGGMWRGVTRRCVMARVAPLRSHVYGAYLRNRTLRRRGSPLRGSEHRRTEREKSNSGAEASVIVGRMLRRIQTASILAWHNASHGNKLPTVESPSTRCDQIDPIVTSFATMHQSAVEQ